MHLVYVYLWDDVTLSVGMDKVTKRDFQQTGTDAASAIWEKVKMKEYKSLKSQSL